MPCNCTAASGTESIVFIEDVYCRQQQQQDEICSADAS